MILSCPIDSTLMHNKFLNLVVVLWFWDFGRSSDHGEPDCSGIRGKFDVRYVTRTTGMNETHCIDKLTFPSEEGR